MLQLGGTFHCMDELPFEERVKKVRERGLSCVQLALRKAKCGYPVESENLTPGLAMHMKKIFDRNQVDVAVLGCYLHITTPDEKEYEEALKYYRANIQFAAVLGAGVVGTETGSLSLNNGFTPENNSEEAFDFFIRRFKPIVEYAEKMGVTVAVEPVWCHVVNTVERARRMLDIIASPNLRIILDAANLISPENYGKQDEMIEKSFDLLGEDIAVLHIKDFVIENGEKKNFAPVGEGQLHIEKLLKLCKEKKPYAHMIVDGFTLDTIGRTVQNINRIYNEV